jgi:hypothetical protein
MLGNMQDLKIWFFNATALSVATFSTIELGLKIVLLLVSIGYTLDRWFNNKKK